MYILFVLGVSLWIAYGLFLRDLPLILGNVVTLLFAAVILSYKIFEVRSRKSL